MCGYGPIGFARMFGRKFSPVRSLNCAATSWRGREFYVTRNSPCQDRSTRL